MQRKETNPTGRMDCILVRMFTGFSDLVRDIVNGDDGVEQHHDHEKEKEEREIVKKRIAHQSSTLFLGKRRKHRFDANRRIDDPKIFPR
jgi:hypothetical protein